jgi:hypothetical protein
METTERVENTDDAILVLRQSLGQTVQLIEESWAGDDARVTKVLADAKAVLSMTSSLDPRTPSSVDDATPTTTAEQEREKTRERSQTLG